MENTNIEPTNSDFKSIQIKLYRLSSSSILHIPSYSSSISQIIHHTPRLLSLPKVGHQRINARSTHRAAQQDPEENGRYGNVPWPRASHLETGRGKDLRFSGIAGVVIFYV
jgi:hypothetical protein